VGGVSNLGQINAYSSSVGDGRRGYSQDAPFDAIHVGAAAAQLPSEVRDYATVIVYIFNFRVWFVC